MRRETRYCFDGELISTTQNDLPTRLYAVFDIYALPATHGRWPTSSRKIGETTVGEEGSRHAQDDDASSTR
jgi:hypothetical protein